MRYRIRRLSQFAGLVALAGALLSGPGDAQSTAVQNQTEQQRVFQEYWEIMAQYYPMMTRKGIDWQDTYATYRPRLTATSSDQDLFNLLREIDHLVVKDGHTGTTYRDDYDTGYEPEMNMASLEIVETITPSLVVLRGKSASNDYLSFGTVRSHPEIGYILSKQFEPLQDSRAETRRFERIVDAALDTLKDKKAIIIDLRINGGGQAVFGYYLAGRFLQSDFPVPLLRQRVRRGAGLSDWITDEFDGVADSRAEGGTVGSTFPSEHRPERTGEFQYIRPVVLLTSRGTASAAELFVAALHGQPHVTTLGERTFGIFAGSEVFTLRNGGGRWKLRVSVHDTELLFRGQFQSFEGIGISPGVVVSPTQSDLIRGVDPQLNKAVQILSSG